MTTQSILAATNGVIDLAEERFTKNLWTDRQSIERPYLVTARDEVDQAFYIAERMLKNREEGMNLNSRQFCFVPRTTVPQLNSS